jgi:hypothetical protein
MEDSGILQWNAVIGLLLPVISKEHNALIFKGWGVQKKSRNTNLATYWHNADDLNCQKLFKKPGGELN